MGRLFSVSALVIGLALGACGDDPEAKCNEMAEALCSKTAECIGAAGGSASDIKSQCLSGWSSTCENAEEINGDVDACIDAVKEMECGSFSSGLPDACS